MHRHARLLTQWLFALSIPFAAEPSFAAGWAEALQAQVARIDQETRGSLGVYVKELGSGEALEYGSDQFWYLGSTVKVPVAIATLQQVDAGRLKLTDAVTLTEALASRPASSSGNRAARATPSTSC